MEYKWIILWLIFSVSIVYWDINRLNEGEDVTYRYVVHFNIADEDVSKFFNDEEHAKKFAKMVDGKITTYTETNYGKDDK